METPSRPKVVAYIALGANLGDRSANLLQAIDHLNATADIGVLRVSSFLENAALGGPPDSPAFLNAVAAVETTLPPAALLASLLAIETRMGRVRALKNDPRPIDLDLILYGDMVVHLPDLEIPHPRMQERSFVLGPLAQIAPLLVHPVLGKTIEELVQLKPG